MKSTRMFAYAIYLSTSLVTLAEGHDVVSGIPANPTREAYYGDLHLHTTYSFDVYVLSNVTPDEAYRFARGEPVTYLNETVRRSTLPLDFLAVTDHSENIGVYNKLDDPNSEVSQSEFGQLVHKEGAQILGKAYVRLMDGIKHLSRVADISRKTVDAATEDAWQREIDAANRNYQPGKFTTFIAYEWSSTPGIRNLHRNVIFRGDRAPRPFSAADSIKPEDLWSYLEEVRRKGYEVLAIPHNANASGGLMFDWVDSSGKPIDQAYAKRRAANEPLVEIVQLKGQSETHPELSPVDEFANFEIMDFLKEFHGGIPSRTPGSYVRDALGRGLEVSQRTLGANPYKYGFVGGSDLHTGLSDSSEGAQADRALRALHRSKWEKAFGKGADEQFNAMFSRDSDEFTNYSYYEMGSPGLTGVWAEQNTRESIFAALQRKETFATSGTRLKFRFFGGWDYPENLLQRPDWVQTAYGKGVPMGGDLVPDALPKCGPVFAVWAVKDPEGANLDRLQIVKVWLNAGVHNEKIYDVALSNGRYVNPITGKAPPVGNTVDVRTAAYKNTIGATKLSSIWRDPDFDPKSPALYYLRVIEIPTPRYSTIVMERLNERLPEGIPATIQERGWSSPIWYTPPRK